MFTLGNRINFLRTNSHLSLDELSSILSTAKSTLSRIENDKVSPSSELILAISKFFNVSTDWLLTGKEFSKDKSCCGSHQYKYFSLLEIFNLASYESDEVYVKTAMEIGDRIWYLMEQFRFSSQSLSNYINTTFSPFFNISSEDIISFHYGKKIPSKENLFIFSKVLNVTPEWILVGDSIQTTIKNTNEVLDFELGKRIKMCIGQIDLPLDIKAKAIGITVKDIFDYQYGNVPNKAILKKIAFFCNVSLEWLSNGHAKTSAEKFSDFNKIQNDFKLYNDANDTLIEKNGHNELLTLLESIPDDLIDEIKKYIEFRITYLRYKNNKLCSYH